MTDDSKFLPCYLTYFSKMFSFVHLICGLLYGVLAGSLLVCGTYLWVLGLARPGSLNGWGFRLGEGLRISGLCLLAPAFLGGKGNSYTML